MRNILVIALCFLLGACSTKTQHMETAAPQESSINLARIAKKNKLYGAAIRLYSEALELHPEDPVLLFEQGEVYALAGQCNRAEKQFAESSISHADPAGITKSLGRCFAKEENFTKALNVLLKGEQYGADDPQYLNLLGTTYSFSGNTSRGKKALEKALELAPDDMEIKNNIAVVHIIEGKYDIAIQKLSRLLRRGYNTARIRHNLALAYGLADKTEQAEKVYGIDLSSEQIKQNLAWYRLVKQNKTTRN
ncbi:tetratricopeptide repeat protein [Halodesulfovibrio sp.]|uniref:tetratricopeptide repeat protein n=1 Tax=Halodesulfovibrio sp. TaxID=1912772 RepID=UPI0025FD8424|nr:tetratricopeptide repeat protein [Halodesulfovibrio sp.]MCT4535248.1 tetratricopeptide repeat protein [Halodesulfovibrio sp.]